MLAVVCPGQGAQSPGMLAPWLELPSVAESIARASRTTGLDLVAHGTTSDADTIRDTAVAQPLLVASALASLRAVLDLGADDAARRRRPARRRRDRRATPSASSPRPRSPAC